MQNATFDTNNAKPLAEEFLLRNEVAQIYRVSLRTVDNLVREKRINFLRIGRSVRFRRSEIEGKA